MAHKGPYAKRCKSCLYVLDGLAAGACPECGAYFHPENRTTYFYWPPYSRWRYWIPGVMLALIAGALSIGSLFGMQSLGTGLVFGTPIMIGALLGYGTRSFRLLAPILLVLTLIVALGTMLVTMQLAGVICGLILAAIFIVPLLIGVAVGAVLRVTLRGTRYSMETYLPIVLLVLIPPTIGLVEKKGFSNRIEVIATTRTLQVAPSRAWDALQFYEETKLEPSAFLRFTIPLPRGCEGARANPGDVTLCHYEGGHLTKRILDVRPPELLKFDVIEQQLEFDGAIHLEGGSFRFTPTAQGTTDATLETTYRSALRPRWVWRWGEECVVHALHDHVLRCIEADAQKSPPPRAGAGSASE